MEAIKSTVGELSQKEQDELMLFILQNRSGSKKGKVKKEPSETKREMSEGQKAWTDYIRHVTSVVTASLKGDEKFIYKNAMSVASALKKAGKLAATDMEILTFYDIWKKSGGASSASSAASSDVESVVAKPVVETKPKKAKAEVKKAEPKVEVKKAEPKKTKKAFKGKWSFEGVEYERDNNLVYTLDGTWVGLYDVESNTIDTDAEEPTQDYA
jgi:hypothetical protein